MNIFDDEIKKQIKEIMYKIYDKNIYNNLNKTLEIFDKKYIPLEEVSKYLSTVTDTFKNVNIPMVNIDERVIEYFSSVNSIIKDFTKYYNDRKFFLNNIKNVNYITDGETKVSPSKAPDVIILKRIFPEILLSDCESFINYISQYPMLSYKHEIGKNIYELVSKIDKKEINGIEIFRVRKNEYNKKLAYTDNEMFLAPYKLTQQSRFSSTGQNYLYASETLKAAKDEVQLVQGDLYTWIKFKVKKSFIFLDIRDKNIPLFEYCHIKSEDKNLKLNTEYLLPNYIADCAKQIGFEGIQYYSVIDTNINNYVFFKPGNGDFLVTERGKETI